MLQRILCRLNLHHKWQMLSTEDGGRYARCTWCYRDATGRASKVIDPFAPINFPKGPKS